MFVPCYLNFKFISETLGCCGTFIKFVTNKEKMGSNYHL